MPITDEAVSAHQLENAFRVSVFEWTTCPTPEHKAMQMGYQRLKSQQDFRVGELNCEQLHNATGHKQLKQEAAQVAIRGVNPQSLHDYRTLQLSTHSLAVSNADEILRVHALQEKLDRERGDREAQRTHEASNPRSSVLIRPPATHVASVIAELAARITMQRSA